LPSRHKYSRKEENDDCDFESKRTIFDGVRLVITATVENYFLRHSSNILLRHCSKEQKISAARRPATFDESSQISNN